MSFFSRLSFTSLGKLTQSTARWAVLAACVFSGATFAIARDVALVVPPTAAPGSTVHVTVNVQTELKDGEHIGFLHAEYSTDDGKTWKGFAYDQDLKQFATRSADITMGASGSKAIVRVRVAFRGGNAGDVDFNGGAIKWTESWTKWLSPPTKVAVIRTTP